MAGARVAVFFAAVFFAAGFLVAALRVTAFFAAAFLAATVFLVPTVFRPGGTVFLAVRVVVSFGFSLGVFAAVAPTARRVAVATFFAAGTFLGAALRAPVDFLALVRLAGRARRASAMSAPPTPFRLSRTPAPVSHYPIGQTRTRPSGP